MTALGSVLETLTLLPGAVCCFVCTVLDFRHRLDVGREPSKWLLVFLLTVGVLAVAQAFHPPVRWFVSATLILGGGSLTVDCVLAVWRIWRKRHDRS